MAVVTPTDRPRLVHNRLCKILVVFLWCHVALSDFPVYVGAFVICLDQVSSFFPQIKKKKKKKKNRFLPIETNDK